MLFWLCIVEMVWIYSFNFFYFFSYNFVDKWFNCIKDILFFNWIFIEEDVYVLFL